MDKTSSYYVKNESPNFPLIIVKKSYFEKLTVNREIAFFNRQNGLLLIYVSVICLLTEHQGVKNALDTQEGIIQPNTTHISRQVRQSYRTQITLVGVELSSSTTKGAPFETLIVRHRKNRSTFVLI